MAKRKPSTSHTSDSLEPLPIDNTPRRDIAAVNSRLLEVTHNLMAIHRISVDAIDGNLAERQDLLLLIRETARSSARAVDICMQRLGADFPVGCFADD